MDLADPDADNRFMTIIGIHYPLCILFSRLGHLPPSAFHARLNFSHLLECLKGVLNAYENLDRSPRERDEMSATYLVLNLGSVDASRWAVNVDHSLRLVGKTIVGL